jgi:prophage regulatory protein
MDKNIFDNSTIVRPSDAAKLLGISKSSLYRFIKEGLLPRPIKVGKRASGWRFSTLNDYLQARAGN